MMGCTDEEPRKAAGLTGPGGGRPADPSPRGQLGAWSPAGGERECLHEEYSGTDLDDLHSWLPKISPRLCQGGHNHGGPCSESCK